MRPSRLLPLILARRHTIMPRPATFTPREVTPEEAATLAALSARGEWDRQADEREATPAALRDLARRAFVAFRRTRAQPAKVQERVYGARRDGR